MNITIEETITAADQHRHISHQIEIPEGTTQIRIDFVAGPEYSSGQEFRNSMSMSLFDRNGPRGIHYWITEGSLTLSAAYTTPGLNSGPIPAGTWTIFVHTYRIRPPDPVTYRFDVSLTSETITDEPPMFAEKQKIQRGPGWYRGDLHAHTVHSDGSWDVPDLVAFARERGLDFVTLTDHNTISGLPHHDILTDDTILTMGGFELTTYYGHALALGKRHMFGWQLDTEDGVTMPQVAQSVLDGGGVFVIAHPMAPGDPVCSGCHWEYEDMRPGNARAVEIWNGWWGDYNEEGLQVYYSWLNAGHRLVATSGTDIHGPPPSANGRHAGFNVVFSEELCEAAILDAISKGHSYLSAGPELLFTAETVSGQSAMVGDAIRDSAMMLKAVWQDASEGDMVRLIVDGEVREQISVGRSGEHTWSFASGVLKWANVELRDANSDMRAVTNPIFVGPNWE